MHDSVREWVGAKTRQYDFGGADVLEVGSLDVNGTVRDLFTGARSYTGVDFRAGPGVDRVMNAHRLEFADDAFDVVVSTEMLEHDDAFWESMREMGRVLKPRGVLIVTARGNGFMPHGYPHDYWRFMPESVEKLLALAGCEPLEVTQDWQGGHPGVFGLGRKTIPEPAPAAPEGAPASSTPSSPPDARKAPRRPRPRADGENHA